MYLFKVIICFLVLFLASGCASEDDNNDSSVAGRTWNVNDMVLVGSDNIGTYWVTTDGSGLIALSILSNGTQNWFVPDDAFVRRLNLDDRARESGYVFSSNNAYAMNTGDTTVPYSFFYPDGSSSTGNPTANQCVDYDGNGRFTNICSEDLHLRYCVLNPNSFWYCGDTSPGGSKFPFRSGTSESIPEFSQAIGTVRIAACFYPDIPRVTQNIETFSCE